MELPKRYEPEEQEVAMQKFWEENDIYAFDEDSDKPVFSIDTPPPTLSGAMHLGHAFSYTQGDFIARFKRMQGNNVFYPFGTDDNGLPTERLIEKQKGIRAKNMDRSEFRKIVLDAVKEQLPAFSKDWQDVAISAEFNSAYSTIDEHSRKTSQQSFLDLFNKNLVYRKNSPISWCVTCQTAIAQAEFESVEKKSHMNTLLFTSTEGEALHIATTRPELLPACVAVCFNPGDDRFLHLEGLHANVPLFDFTVPIIPDASVAIDKGTGLMMVCTFGDQEDVEKWKKYDLPLKSVFTFDGKCNALAGPYKDLRIQEARKKIIEDLKEKNFLLEQVAITHAVNVHERCGTDLEILESPQWFVNVLDHKDELLGAGKQINWYPAHMKTRYDHWVTNLNWDWCISRQRPYGVAFPVWYEKKSGTIVLPELDELPIDPTESFPKAWVGREDELTGETDVMDTWATSSCSPQIALNWSEDPTHFKKQFPMSVRLQAHDIIRTWAFYTIVKAKYHHDSIPWEDIVISGHALDSKGRKMSKSKGNSVDPRQVLSDFGADALRYWAASTKLGEDLSFMEKDLVTGKKTITKLYNASKFAMMHLENYDGNVPEAELELIDKWILSKFYAMVKRATDSFEVYDYSRTKHEVENFFWNTFTADYVELIKDRLYSETRSEEEKRSAHFTLYTVLLGQVKLLAPIMPHITEFIYQSFFTEKDGHKSIHISDWPQVREEFVDEQAEQAGDVIAQLLTDVRKYKSEKQLSMKHEFPAAIITCSEHTRKAIELALPDFQSTAGILDVEFDVGEQTSIKIID